MQQVNLIDSFRRGLQVAILAFGLVGGWILRYPHPLFYAAIILASVFVPYLAVVLLITVLCWSYGGGHATRRF